MQERKRTMPRLVSGEYRVCADCYGPMRKMPGLTIWMCEMCMGVNYILPAEWEMEEDTEEQQQDEALYKYETSGE